MIEFANDIPKQLGSEVDTSSFRATLGKFEISPCQTRGAQGSSVVLVASNSRRILMFRLWTAALLLYGSVAGSLAAQQTKEAPPRIRVTQFGPESKRVIGMPVSLGADT